MVKRSSLILATGLLFFILFMPLFSFVSDLSLKCEIQDNYNCGDYVLMQGIATSGMIFGLLLSVGGAYQSRIKSSPQIAGMYSIVETHDISSNETLSMLETEFDKMLEKAQKNMEKDFKKQKDVIEHTKLELTLKMEEYIQNKPESPTLEINDSAVAGSVTVNNVHEIAKAAVMSYEMGLKS